MFVSVRGELWFGGEGKNVCVVGGDGRKQKWMGAKSLTCVLSVDTQYFTDKLLLIGCI